MMLKPQDQRTVGVMAILIAMLLAELWLFTHIPSILPGLAGRALLAATGLLGLGAAWALTAWERKARRTDS